MCTFVPEFSEVFTSENVLFRSNVSIDFVDLSTAVSLYLMLVVIIQNDALETN